MRTPAAPKKGHSACRARSSQHLGASSGIRRHTKGRLKERVCCTPIEYELLPDRTPAPPEVSHPEWKPNNGAVQIVTRRATDPFTFARPYLFPSYAGRRVPERQRMWRVLLRSLVDAADYRGNSHQSHRYQHPASDRISNTALLWRADIFRTLWTTLRATPGRKQRDSRAHLCFPGPQALCIANIKSATQACPGIAWETALPHGGSSERNCRCRCSRVGAQSCPPARSCAPIAFWPQGSRDRR